MAERLLTYQDLAGRFQVSPRTLRRWFIAYRVRLFRPTLNTVRISEDELQNFIAQQTRRQQQQAAQAQARARGAR